MKYYDIHWTEKDDIDDKIRSVFYHIKLKIDISFKKEVIKNKWNMPRAFWFLEKDEKKFNEIIELYPETKEYFKEKVVT